MPRAACLEARTADRSAFTPPCHVVSSRAADSAELEFLVLVSNLYDACQLSCNEECVCVCERKGFGETLVAPCDRMTCCE